MFQYGALTRGSGCDPRELTFAVVDVETTGLDPARGSRVCEVGVVRMGGDGQVRDEYATLVDPGLSRITNSYVHGVTTAMAADAPTFEQIAGDLLAALSDAIVVGHNLEFEEKFLTAELTRLGRPLTGVPGLCTLVTARSQLDLGSYRLGDLAFRLTGEWPSDQHAALGDARACARVLAVLIAEAPHPLRYVGPPPRPLPALPRSGHVTARTMEVGDGEGGVTRVSSSPAWHACWRGEELDPRECHGRFLSAGASSGSLVTTRPPRDAAAAARRGRTPSSPSSRRPQKGWADGTPGED